MPKYILKNDTTYNGKVFRAGWVIDSTQVNVAELALCGGLLILLPEKEGEIVSTMLRYNRLPEAAIPEALSKPGQGELDPSGGGGNISVLDEGVPVVPAATELDFQGPGVSVAPGAPGRAVVTVGGAGSLAIYDEGVLVKAAVTEIDFIGADVLSKDDGVPNRVSVYIPPPVFLSHWNTADGSNGNQAVGESISRALTHIATPSGGEGTPFKTGGWAGTNQSTTLNGVMTFTTPNETTGFGGTSTMTVTVFDADGVSVIDTFTTPNLTADGAYPNGTGRIVVTLSLFGADTTRFKAKASVQVNVAAILAAVGWSGGRIHVVVTHTTDPATDGTGPHVYTQTDVFLDTNPSTPSISGAVGMTETVGLVLTKHLSGVEFYVLNSQFTLSVGGIDDLNANTSRTAGNLELSAPDYGVPALSQCPFGTGAANFLGWTNNNDNVGASYAKTDWAITSANYRFCDYTANAAAYDRDAWANGTTVNSLDASVLIDTYGTTSTALAEYFDDEARREDPASFPGVGSWVSTASLIAGQAQVFGGQLIVPNQSRTIPGNVLNANWSGYKPDLGGANPDYTALGAPVSYGRRFTKAPGSLIPSMSIVFGGTFAAGNALADLVAGNIEIYVYRIAGLGHVGPPPANTWPLRVHVAFNFALYDDGATVPGSGIREGSSVGNTINCTFGTGTPADTGFYCHVVIVNPATKIDSMVVTFF